jgi:hypothetical protein
MKNFLLGVMITVLCVVAGCANDQARWPKYLYKVVDVSMEDTDTSKWDKSRIEKELKYEIERELSSAGFFRWKLISVNRSGPAEWRLFFVKETL